MKLCPNLICTFSAKDVKLRKYVPQINLHVFRYLLQNAGVLGTFYFQARVFGYNFSWPF